jgi:tRNA-dihydrouridine synthase A
MQNITPETPEINAPPKLYKNSSNIENYLTTDESCLIPPEKMHRISIAPMVDVSDTHFRFFMRLLTRYSTVWTEMLHFNSILLKNNGNYDNLKFHQIEHPVVCQVGGCDPIKLAECAKLVLKSGYDEINLNCGCPSPRVQSGSFGACLMKDAALVSDCIISMQKAVNYEIPVHVKCRIGVDEFDSYEFFKTFIETIYNKTGNKMFIVHARKAHLKGLSPKENRNIPPLMYERAYQLKRDLPEIQLQINGGFKTSEMIEEALSPDLGIFFFQYCRDARGHAW